MSDQVHEIKDKLNIVDVLSGYLRLEKAGVNYKALCPFHNEKTPSFMVSPSRQSWHCFGCGDGGDIFTFVQKIEGVEFPDALKTLADKAGIRLEREDPRLRSERVKFYEICEKATQFFESQLEIQPKIKDYLKNRGLLPETIENWRIGYAPDSWDSLLSFLRLKGYQELDIEKAGLILRGQKYHDRFRNRLMFPIFDINTRPIGFSGRMMNELLPSKTEKDDAGKYINTPETVLYNKSRILYGLDRAKTEIRKQGFAVLVEGQFDEILPYQDGVKNIIATCGTALTEEHLEILKRLCDKLIFSFDIDEAGLRATKRGVDLALRAGFDIQILNIGSGKDPADFVKEKPGEFIKLTQTARPIIDYYFEQNFNKFDKNTLEGKKFIARAILTEIKRLTSAIERSHWISELSLRLGVAEKDLEDEMRHILIDSDIAEVSFKKPAAGNLKSRKEILAERILALALRTPENLANVSQIISFLPPHYFEIASAIHKAKTGFNFSMIREHLPLDLRSKLDYLAMLADHEAEKNSKDFNPEQEAIFLAGELEREHWREIQVRMLETIKKAEIEKSPKLKELTDEFQIISKKLHNIGVNK